MNKNICEKEVRCASCNRLLAKTASKLKGLEIKCSRCKAVNEYKKPSSYFDGLNESFKNEKSKKYCAPRHALVWREA